MPEVQDQPVANTTVYWFVKMEIALESGDLETVLHAKKQLRRLGVIVEYSGLKLREVTNAAR